jgi:hypothetical protein
MSDEGPAVSGTIDYEAFLASIPEAPAMVAVCEASRLEGDVMRPDWDTLIDDVNARIKALRVCWKATATREPALHAQLVRDLYVPALKLLADFCAAVDIEELP